MTIMTVVLSMMVTNYTDDDDDVDVEEDQMEKVRKEGRMMETMVVQAKIK